ncbi:AAA family ATPase [Aeromonas sobria]|uniref:AAA family ATPase n=1 Tax=Aeromonas sobria TaxID=646 RepID=UPI003F34BA4D
MLLGKELTKKDTLDSDLRSYINTLPYWSQFVASKVYLNGRLSQDDFNLAYKYLLSALYITPPEIRTPISINPDSGVKNEYRKELKLNSLKDVDGVNALSGNQIIEFGPNLTIIYGENGSGKSGYVRLLKQVLHSKSAEIIEPNIHKEHIKSPSANFTFSSNEETLSRSYPDDNATPEFKQFSVFDGKCIIKHLAEKNEFEFRPNGLSFFSNFSYAISQLEEKLNTETSSKNKPNIYTDIFDGDSEVKDIISSLSAQTDIKKLMECAQFTDEHVLATQELTLKCDELLLRTRNKALEIETLRGTKDLLAKSKESLEKINLRFSHERLWEINNLILDYNKKLEISKSEGASAFETDKIVGVNTPQWRTFISSANSLAAQQYQKHLSYPQHGDNCIFCQQALSDDAIKLIESYWDFLKSEAEEQERKAADVLKKITDDFSSVIFDVFPESHILSEWLKKNYPTELDNIRNELNTQKQYAETIISALQSKRLLEITSPSQTNFQCDAILIHINTTIQSLEKDEVLVELNKLTSLKTALLHREKLSHHIDKIKYYVEEMCWVNKAKSADFAKAKITTAEKSLSKKHFNNEYITLFNVECEKLNGDFGIDIDHTGSAGKSYRQLKIKGKKPSSILSEGEQKVIAMADFITEMSLSEINRGIVFDDPVTSLDDRRKLQIAKRLADEADSKQVIIFTHDLIFVSNLISYCQDNGKEHVCHWIEKRNGIPGFVFLKNSPSYEKEYRNSEPASRHLKEAEKQNCSPETREFLLRQGFTALRTCYEVLVISELFCNVVQRYNERVSMESLSKVAFDKTLVEDIMINYGLCCRFMEGHTHSDKYLHKKPDISDLKDEITRYDKTKAKIREKKKELSMV